MCMCVYIYICICMYTYIYIYIHTCVRPKTSEPWSLTRRMSKTSGRAARKLIPASDQQTSCVNKVACFQHDK